METQVLYPSTSQRKEINTMCYTDKLKLPAAEDTIHEAVQAIAKAAVHSDCSCMQDTYARVNVAAEIIDAVQAAGQAGPVNEIHPYGWKFGAWPDRMRELERLAGEAIGQLLTRQEINWGLQQQLRRLAVGNITLDPVGAA